MVQLFAQKKIIFQFGAPRYIRNLCSFSFNVLPHNASDWCMFGMEFSAIVRTYCVSGLQGSPITIVRNKLALIKKKTEERGNNPNGMATRVFARVGPSLLFFRKYFPRRSVVATPATG